MFESLSTVQKCSLSSLKTRNWIEESTVKLFNFISDVYLIKAAKEVEKANE